jgi:RNA polymerase sigma factor (sigma-70 family)
MIATRAESADRELVDAVRAGDDSAFEELYRRYQPRIAAFLRRKVGDPARAEDIAQDVFFSALRRLRATEAEIDFKPWVFQIATNAAIDHWRRTSRAEEISVDADEGMRQSDRVRLTGAAGPDSVLVDKERFEHLRGAFDELSDMHSRILVMRELEGLSYREISERLDVSRASVESTLFRARRRLESEYADISEGRRCMAMRGVIARISEGVGGKREVGRLARHARRCHVCRRRARELGVNPLPRLSGLRSKAAAFLPLPFVVRRGGGGHGVLSGLLPAGGQVSTAVAERAAALVAAAAIAGAGGMAIGGGEVLGGDGEPERPPATEQRKTGSGMESGTNRSPATRSHPRPGGVAGEPDPRRGGPRSGRTGAARPDRGGAGAAGGAGVDGAGGAGAAGTDGATGAGRGVETPGAGAGAGLPGVPDLSPGVGGGAPNGPGADVPSLPDGPSPPQPPSVRLPRLPDAPSPPGAESPPVTPPSPPRVESAPSVPVEPPATPEVPQVDTGAQLDPVTGIGGG